MASRRCPKILVVLGTLALLWSAGTPAYAAFPGSNGRLAFQREMPAGDHTQTDVFTIRSHGLWLTALTRTPDQNEFGPAWNATGTRLAFWRTPAPFGPGAIWTMDARGRNQVQLTSGIDARDPVWNPAGTRIAFTNASGGNFDIWVMRAADGRGRVPIVSGPTLDFEPAWSPDGARVAFTRGFDDGDNGDIYVVDLRTGVITQVTSSPAYDHQVAWSPDGTRLTFQRETGGASSIYTVNAAGTALNRLTAGPFFDVGPAFSPDGRFVAFGSDRGAAVLGDLWLMDSDGTNRHPVRQLEFSEGFPDWQPLTS